MTPAPEYERWVTYAMRVALIAAVAGTSVTLGLLGLVAVVPFAREERLWLAAVAAGAAIPLWVVFHLLRKAATLFR